MRVLIYAAVALLLLSFGESSWAQRNSQCAGITLPLRLATGGSSPYVDIKLEQKTGPFLIDYGNGSSAIEHGVWAFTDDDVRWSGPPGDPHQSINLAGFGFPGWLPDTKIRFNESNLDKIVAGIGLQHGVVGIDLLVRQDLEFHYENPSSAWVAVSKYGGSCDSKALEKNGFKRISQVSHWDSNVSNPPDGVYNGPVVYLELADVSKPDIRLGVATWAQLDTGYEDDLLPFTVDINDALFAKLMALQPPLTEGKKISVRGCDGKPRDRRVFTAPSRILRVEDGSGEKIAEVTGFHFVLKNKDEQCGGISSTAVPAGQIGASFLRAFRITIFMGPSKEVWIAP